MSAPEESKKPKDLGIHEGVIYTENITTSTQNNIKGQLNEMGLSDEKPKDVRPAFDVHPNQWTMQTSSLEDEGSTLPSESNTKNSGDTLNEMVEQVLPGEGLDKFGRLADSGEQEKRFLEKLKKKAHRQHPNQEVQVVASVSSKK